MAKFIKDDHGKELKVVKLNDENVIKHKEKRAYFEKDSKVVYFYRDTEGGIYYDKDDEQVYIVPYEEGNEITSKDLYSKDDEDQTKEDNNSKLGSILNRAKNINSKKEE